MTYSYTQINQYLACPRRYRQRYLEGWREKETRAAMLFGRAFEKALAAFFLRQDPQAALFEHWAPYQETPLEYAPNDSWERSFHQGVTLLERLAQEDRVRIPQPRRNLQVKLSRALGPGKEFVAYLDAIGTLDGRHGLIEWKTTTSRYPEEPQGLLALDPQLTCYSWISGLENVALVVFVRKRVPEIQYLHTQITAQQRQDYGQLVEDTLARIEAGHFLPHPGIRFPQNGCVSCPHLGLCLGNQQLIDSKLVRLSGASDLDWLDQLED